jgi:integrase
VSRRRKKEPAPKREKKTRAPRGTGTIFYNKRRRYWVGRLPVGRDLKGRTTYLERTGRTQKEVVAKLRAAGPPGPDVTVAEWVARWLEDLGVRPGTEDNYRHSAARRIVPALGSMRVADVTPLHVERAMRAWARDVSPATARLTAGHLGACLGTAVRAGLIPSNPVARSKKPKVERKKMTPFSPAELERVRGAAAARVNLRPVALLAATGMRVGEAVALDVPDFDQLAGTVRITKTQPVKPGRPVGPPKSPHSVRTIRVPASVVPVLVAAVGGRKSGPLFRTLTGARTTRSLVARPWVGFLKGLGLPYRNLHQLRHGVATALVSAGVPLGDVARFLGDVVATIVANYLHPTQCDVTVALEKILTGRASTSAA